jgi:succinate dehydrogenase / fumarate reductase membrane anchor subunit
MATRTIIQSGRPRVVGSNFELWAWFFMRLSGVVLILLAVFHLLYMHFVIGVDKITFDTIVQRWTGNLGALWRVYDFLLLAFGFSHGMNGLRVVAEDYVPRGGWMILAKSAIVVLWFTLLSMGAYIIFTFKG